MAEKKKRIGRPPGSGDGRRKAMLSRRIDAELLEQFKAYVQSIVPRTTDTAVLELALAEFLQNRKAKR